MLSYTPTNSQKLLLKHPTPATCRRGDPRQTAGGLACSLARLSQLSYTPSNIPKPKSVLIIQTTYNRPLQRRDPRMLS